MREERQQFLGAAPYERTSKRADQANGFYERTLTSSLGLMELAVPRSRSGAFRRNLRRYQRREAVVDEALRRVFLWECAPGKRVRRWRGLLDEAVSAATVSAVAKCWTNRWPSGIGAH